MAIHKTGKSLGAALHKHAETTIPNAVKEAQKRIARKIWRKLLEVTPVSTGHARGNWNASLGEPDGSVKKTTDTGMREEEIEAVLAQLDFVPVGTTVWIANGVYYMRILESGSSKQAPAGIVALTLAEIEADVL